MTLDFRVILVVITYFAVLYGFKTMVRKLFTRSWLTLS